MVLSRTNCWPRPQNGKSPKVSSQNYHWGFPNSSTLPLNLKCSFSQSIFAPTTVFAILQLVYILTLLSTPSSYTFRKLQWVANGGTSWLQCCHACERKPLDFIPAESPGTSQTVYLAKLDSLHNGLAVTHQLLTSIPPTVPINIYFFADNQSSIINTLNPHNSLGKTLHLQIHCHGTSLQSVLDEYLSLVQVSATLLAIGYDKEGRECRGYKNEGGGN